MAWCFREEASSYAESVLQSLSAAEAVAPSLWPLEVANVLLVGERRHRITPADSSRFLALLGTLPITVDPETSRRALDSILSLARVHRLSSYDAAYLDAAMRHGLPLATLDDGLKKAAKSIGVSAFIPPPR